MAIEQMGVSTFFGLFSTIARMEIKSAPNGVRCAYM